MERTKAAKPPCPTCGALILRKGGTYCSYACWQQDHRVERTCPNCGRIFSTPRSNVERGRMVACSAKCRDILSRSRPVLEHNGVAYYQYRKDTIARRRTRCSTALYGKVTTARSRLTSLFGTSTATSTITTSQTSRLFTVERSLSKHTVSLKLRAVSASARPEPAASATATTSNFELRKRAAGKKSSAGVLE